MSFLVDIPGRPVLFSLKGNGRKIDLGERRGGGGTVKSGEIVNCCPSMRKEQKGKKYKSKTIINKSLNNFLKKKHRKQDLLKWNRSLGVWPLDYILSLGPYSFFLHFCFTTCFCHSVLLYHGPEKMEPHDHRLKP